MQQPDIASMEQLSNRVASSDHGRLDAGARLLVVGMNYWPEESGVAPYTTGLTEHLRNNGVQVDVLTSMPHYPGWAVPPAYGGRLRTSEICNGINIRRLRTYVPGHQDAIRRIGYEAGFLVNGLVPTNLARPDAILGIVPSLSGAGLAAYLGRRYRVPYGLLFQDLIGAAAQQSGIRGGKRVARATRSLEGRLARGAKRVAVISPGFIDYLTSLGVDPGRLVHIRNWSHLAAPTADRDETRARLGWNQSQIVVLHAGAMGNKQGLENVVDTARQAANALPSARFVFMGDGNRRAALVEGAKGLANVDIIPPCAKTDLPDILAAADILLVNERASVSDMSLPSKLTSYMVAGRPIAAAVPRTGFTAREIMDSGAGLVVPPEDPSALLTAISGLAGDPVRSAALGMAGLGWVESTLCPAAILPRLSAFVEHLLAPASSPLGELAPITERS